MCVQVSVCCMCTCNCVLRMHAEYIEYNHNTHVLTSPPFSLLFPSKSATLSPSPQVQWSVDQFDVPGSMEYHFNMLCIQQCMAVECRCTVST